jgi:fibronectin type III domain protein
MQINTGQKTGRALSLGWPTEVKGLMRVLKGVLFLALLFNCVQAFSTTIPATQSITLAWTPSPDTNIMGYNIYYGVASRTYPNVINVGNVTSATISNLVAGVTYYFAATEYDNLGQESGFSDEVSYLAPNGFPTMRIHGMVAGQFILTMTGQINHTYEIQATQDFKTWTTIGNVTIGASGSLDFTDTNAQNFPDRFYRTCDTQP